MIFDGGSVILLAGNFEQVHYWLKHKVIPLTSKNYLDKILDMKLSKDIKLNKIHTMGTYHDWFDQECYDILNIRLEHETIKTFEL